MVQGKGRGYTSPRIVPVVPEIPPTVPEVIVSGEMIPEDIPVSPEIVPTEITEESPIQTEEQNPPFEDVSTESGSIQLPDVPVSDPES